VSQPVSQLLKRLSIPPLEVSGETSTMVHDLVYDSRRVVTGSLFAALRGTHADGHDHMATALESGASVLLCESSPAILKPGTTMVRVEDSRLALAEMASAFYRYPSHKMQVAAVTGTNGKTTTAFLLHHICDMALLRCGMVGTVHYELGGGEIIPASHTTPESVELQQLLARMLDNGCKSVVMEASSHAIEQRRVASVELDAVIFTNLTQDHLDYHLTMDRYFEAKAALFDRAAAQKKKQAIAVINSDDDYGARLVRRLEKSMPVITFGLGAKALFKVGDVRMEASGTRFQLDADGRQYLVRMPLIGRFNVYNALGALAAAHVFGIPLREAVRSLADAAGAPGRMQAVPARRSFHVFVDYAHTPDALENALSTLRQLNPRRLIVVFGCGGDRDRGKRPKMGAIAARLSDIAIVTSDNPRSEEPDAIISDITAGMSGGDGEIIPDRTAAIQRAIEIALPRDIVLIAGKGHENYQEIQGKRHAFDDLQIAGRTIELKQPEHSLPRRP